LDLWNLELLQDSNNNISGIKADLEA